MPIDPALQSAGEGRQHGICEIGYMVWRGKRLAIYADYRLSNQCPLLGVADNSGFIAQAGALLHVDLP